MLVFSGQSVAISGCMILDAVIGVDHNLVMRPSIARGVGNDLV